MSFSVMFSETIKPIFVEMTGIQLFFSERFNNYYKMIDKNELQVIENWEQQQGERVFLRDCLALSIAMSFNFTTNNTDRKYTVIGLLEHNAKNNNDMEAVDALAQHSSKTIKELPFYKDADYICAVPPRPGKNFDLPSQVTEKVAQTLNKKNITNHFNYGKEKESIKSSKVEDKWLYLEKSKLNFDGLDLNGKNIILIDDKYQSGTTIQFVGMKLQKAGAKNVYGLSFVKTMRDTDNQ